MTGNRLTHVIQRLRRAVGGPADGPGDPELLRRYTVAREERAFTELVERHGPMVRGVCRRVLGQDADADDAFQATFLVLARKAGAGFWQESIAGWLYQVAYRTACKARVQTARRQRHEHAAELRPETEVYSPEMCELRQVLDEELSRLPEKFRLPVLLCCLQDQTTDEAARQLGWSFATVKGRLQRGREMLRQRLQKRGVGLSAGVLGTLLAEGSAGAVPPALAASTVQAANGGAIAPVVAVLVKGALYAMFWDKMMIAAMVLVAGAVLGIGGGIGISRMGGGGTVALAVPIPEKGLDKTKPKEGPMASKPIVKDDLEVVVKPTQAVYTVGQAPSLAITYANRGKKAFLLSPISHAVVGWKIINTKTRVSEESLGAGKQTKEIAVRLEPGKSVTRTTKILLEGPGIIPIPVAVKWPAGRYRITVNIRFLENADKNAAAWWSGQITTNPVEVAFVQPQVELPAEVRGQKWLASFSQGKAAEIKAALEKAGVKIVQVVREDEEHPVTDGEMMYLLDTQGKEPAKTFADLAPFVAAVEFQDGNFKQGILGANAPKRGLRNGQLPAPYAVYYWGGVPATRKQREADLARFQSIPGVKVEFHNPSLGIAGAPFWAKLTSADSKITLLEIFLRTKARFAFVDPPVPPQ